MTMIGKIRRMRFRQEKSVREISRTTSLSRNTVRKYLRMEQVQEPKYERSAKSTKLTAFHETIVTALKVDARRPKRERRTALALFEQIKGEGYEGCYSRLTDFIRAWRASHAQSGREAFVPLSFEWGEAFQFDWSDEGLVIGGVYRKLQLAHMKLCASRAFWLTAYPGQGHEMLFDAHARGFAALGVARRGIYDNMKTAVDKVGRGKARAVNERFNAMCAHYLFEADFCNVASGWEKGIVEKNVQDSRRRVWQEATRLRWASLEELNAWLGQRCRQWWVQLRHPEHPAFSVAEMLEHERDHLMPMPLPFDGYVPRQARVSSTCLVAVARNRYSVPCEYAGQMVDTRLYPTRVKVVMANEVVADHARLFDEGRTQYDWQHYIALLERKPGALRNGAPFADLPAALSQLRQALLRERGGDRVMAQVLALVPRLGLDDVLVAVALALEAAPPSGRVSVEHVLNVLARLKETPTPQSVTTPLKAIIPPVADTARYDRLRAKTDDESTADVPGVDHA